VNQPKFRVNRPKRRAKWTSCLLSRTTKH